MAEPRRRFKFLKELAAGGFGKVYLAEMITGDNFSSVVALKLLHGKWTTNDEVVMRSRDEARLLGRLRHRNIVRVEDLTSIQGQCAIVMEYLQGVDLKTACGWLRERNRPFPRQAMFEVTGAIAAALDAAYNQIPLQGGAPLRVIHRDIKPSNAMITVEGDIKVLDFGTARASFDNREAKTQALSFGSAAYMSPERLMGEEDTPAADIFSLGITIYELLTLDSFGKIHIRPEKFEKNVAERLAALDVSALPANLQKEAIETLRGMLAYEPTSRPSAKDVVELMETFADQARDGGLKRFARETVGEIIKTMEPEQDPNDPYTGALIYEDTASFGSVQPGTTTGITSRTYVGDASDVVARPDGTSGASAARPKESTGSGARSNPRLSNGPPSTAPAEPSGARSNPRSVAPSSTSAPTPAAQPPAPPAEDDNPFQVPEDLAEPAAPVSRPPTPPAVATITPGTVPSGPATSGPKSANPPRPTSISPAPRPPEPEPDARPSGGGGLAKALIALVVLGGLGTVAIVAVWFVLGHNSGKTDTPPTTTPPETTAGASLKAGADAPDYAANAPGKGGAILQVPGGAAEVLITGAGKVHEEWDGTKYLRIRDVDPGSLRGKVKPKDGGTALYADFSVESDKTCLWTFSDKDGGSWQKSECR
jgi:serine/threonine protein kinase